MLGDYIPFLLAKNEVQVYSQPMFKSQSQKLNETGLELLDGATRCTKASDVKLFTELGMKCLEEAREILSEMKSNSILIFVECGANVGALGNYGAYLMLGPWEITGPTWISVPGMGWKSSRRRTSRKL